MRALKQLYLFFSLLWREDFLGGRISRKTAWEVADIFYGRKAAEIEHRP